jgi:hypothetical protein
MQTYEAEYDPLTRQRVFSFRGEKHKFSIKKRPRAFNDTPYWIMRVPRSLIADHSAIFGANTVRLVGAILGITGALQPETKALMIREDGVRPTGMVVLPSGDLIFADRTRGVYKVVPDRRSPEFISCFPQGAGPMERIGFMLYDDTALVARSLSVDGGDEDEFHTEFLRASVVGGNLEAERVARMTTNEEFLIATFDPAAKASYLTTGQPAQIYVADLTKKKPEPTLLTSMEDVESISILHYDTGLERLFVADGTRGTLYAFDPGSEGSEPTVVADSLGWPGQMIRGLEAGRFYISDLESKQIWSLDCTGEAVCSEPTVFARSDAFVNPSSLAVTPDGTLWVGDIEAQSIFGFTPDGRLKQTVDRLPSQ